MRLDNIVAELARCSRGKANEILEQERVLVNYEIVQKSSKEIKQNDVITIRGKGRFIVKEIIGNTKKGRIIVNVEGFERKQFNKYKYCKVSFLKKLENIKIELTKNDNITYNMSIEKTKEVKKMGVASLVLGIISLIVGFIPLCGSIALVPGIIALILGIVAIVMNKKKGEKIGVSVAGTAVVIIIFWVFVFGVAMTQVDLNELNSVTDDYYYDYNY